MPSFVRVAVVLESLRSNRTMTKTVVFTELYRVPIFTLAEVQCTDAAGFCHISILSNESVTPTSRDIQAQFD